MLWKGREPRNVLITDLHLQARKWISDKRDVEPRKGLLGGGPVPGGPTEREK